MDEVNLFIQANRGADADFFAGDWMLIAQWDHVHPYPHGSDNTQGIREEVLSKVCQFNSIIGESCIDWSMYICTPAHGFKSICVPSDPIHTL